MPNQKRAGRRPKVALVHDHLIQDGGAERVLRTFMKLWPKAPIYTAYFDPKRMGPDFRGKDIRVSFLGRVPLVRRFYKWPLTLLDAAFRRFDLSEYDLVISSASAWAKSVRTGPNTIHICYCHTPTRYLWSDSDRYISELGYPAFIKWAIKLARPWMRRNDRRAARGVDDFVANSEHIAKRIKQYYDRDATVIYPPVDSSQFKPSRTKGDYYLVATRLVPYKRVDLVIRAFSQLKRPLKIMGDGVDRERLEKLAGPTVEFLGRVPDRQRNRLFAEAKALINPQEEDFGITTVEALAAGTPVIAYGVGGAAEILDAKTGVQFKPQSVDALAKAVWASERKRFSNADLRRRSETFSEPRFKREFARHVQGAYRASRPRTSSES